MRRKLVFGLMLGVCVVAGMIVDVTWRPDVAWADNDDDDEDDDDAVHELMEETHEGRNSPWKKAQGAVSKDPVDWVTLNAALPGLGKMSDALVATRNKEVRDSSDGYVDAVKELMAQSKKKDAAGARAAIKSLSNSCADCHYKDGPGGELDDE